MLLSQCATSEEKNIHIIYGKSTHKNYCHNNKEVGLFLEKKLQEKPFGEHFTVTSSFRYPTDLALVENANLIIISSDGGPGHALAVNKDITTNTAHLDGVLKKGETGLIMIHWATDAPSAGFGKLHPENAALMMEWIGAVYYWDKKEPLKQSWTWKYPVLDLKVNQEHPISKGLPDTFKLQDEYYFNFFTEGTESRNPKNDRVTFLHTSMAPDHRDNIGNEDKYREQASYWAYEREDGGRSIAMTSAHMYHSWANPHYFRTFTNSVLWTLNLPIPEEGAPLPQPTLDDLRAMSGQVQIHKKALHFK